MKLQRILFVLFALLSCIPAIIMSTFNGSSLMNLNQENLKSSYFYSLEQQSVILSLKFNTIETCAKSMATDENLLRYLATSDFNNESQNMEIANIVSRYFHQENLVSDVLFFPSSGGYYSYKNNWIENPVDFMINTGFSKENGSEIFWSGIHSNLLGDDANYFVSSFSLDISNYTSENTNAYVNVFFIVDVNFLNSDTLSENQSYASTYIYDHNGNLLFNDNNEYHLYPTLWDFPSKTVSEILKNKSFVLSQTLENEKKVLFFTRDTIKDYYAIRIVSYDYYNTASRQILQNTILGTILFMLLSVLASFLLAKWINKPLAEFVTTLKNNCLERPVYMKPSKLYPYEFNYLYSKFNAMLQDMNQLHNEKLSSEISLSEAKLNALKYQINPHFINNTLSGIRIKLLEYGIEDVAEMISIFAALIRSSLNNPPIISLWSEIEDLHNYIALMQIRHKNKINITFDIPDELYNQKLQCMLLQPIVENSIRHGLSQKLLTPGAEALINISANKTEQFLIIEIYDNGTGFKNNEYKNILTVAQCPEQNKKHHIGLYNINERIKLMHGNEYGLEIESMSNCYSLVRLKLPNIIEE